VKIKKKLYLKLHFKILLQKNKNATQAAKKVCDVYEHDAVSVHMAQS